MIDELQAYRKRLQQLGRMREADVVDRCVEIVKRALLRSRLAEPVKHTEGDDSTRSN